MNLFKTQQLLERLAGLLRTETRHLLFEHGLQPVQFEALQYLLICNRYSDTLMAVTEYLGQTKGSVSQTLKVLEKKGLIEKHLDHTDKRVAHMSVTADGHALIKAITPSPMLKLTAKYLDENEAVTVESSLHCLLKIIQRANSFNTFGQCVSCCHNIRYSENEFMCGLTKEALTSKDVKLICREHEFNDSTQCLEGLSRS